MSSVFLATFFVYCNRASVLKLMRKNKQVIHKRKTFKHYLQDARSQTNDDASLLKKKFALSKIAKAIWNVPTKCFISNELRIELKLLLSLVDNPKVHWYTPLSHLVDRDPDFQVWGDSSLDCAGGYSHQLKFWWFLEWPQTIKQKTLKYFKINIYENDKLISINLLEYAVVIINYAICSYLIPKSGSSIEYPVLMNWSDNRSAISWTKRAARSTIAGKALARMFCCLAFNNPVACSAEYISTSDNHCADLISRLKTNDQLSFNTLALFQKYPVMQSYHHLTLSPDFLSCLMQGLLSGTCQELGALPQPLLKDPGEDIS